MKDDDLHRFTFLTREPYYVPTLDPGSHLTNTLLLTVKERTSNESTSDMHTYGVRGQWG